MKLRIRWARPTGKHAWASLLLRIALIAVAAVVLIGFSVFGYFYVKYQHVVDERLKQPIFANTCLLYTSTSSCSAPATSASSARASTATSSWASAR